MFFTCLFMCFCLLPVSAEDNESLCVQTVLVVGGGPVGLATAIEAREHGYFVTVVEKRVAYTRLQWIFLSDYSLELLGKWKINIPKMIVADLKDQERMGFVRINELEECLRTRARELGVSIVYGEFQGFCADRLAMIMTSQEELQVLSYDVIVGADGPYSAVRKASSIESSCLGVAVGAIAIVPNSVQEAFEVGVFPSIQQEGGYLRRIQSPFASIFFMQCPQKATQEDLQKALEKQGWIADAVAIQEGRAFVFADIRIMLQQAQTFSHEIKSVILVGDAAATASFFQGRGVNTAFKTAEVSGQFFQEMQICNKAAFQKFNQSMQIITDEMVEDSAYLFKIK